MPEADALRISAALLPRIPNLDGLPALRPARVLLATHTHSAISDDQIEQTLATAATRSEQLVDVVLSDEPLSAVEIRARMFPFWRDDPSRTQAFERRSLPPTLAIIRTIETGAGPTRARRLQEEADELLAQLEQAAGRTPSKQADLTNRTAQGRSEVLLKLEQLQREAPAVVSDIFDLVCSERWILACIKQHRIARKDAKTVIPALLSRELDERIHAYLTKESEAFAALVNAYVDEFKHIDFEFGNGERIRIPFNAEGAFLGGLAGLLSVGALSVWAASLGNLGAYIIVAKFVSLLSALGISISGGTATAAAFVASIGGPVTIAVGIVAITALAGWRLFGDSWEERLATKLVNAIGKKDPRSKCVEQVEPTGGYRGGIPSGRKRT